MHQPNIFLNSYLGYTMWDYESDAPQMWPGPNNTAPRPPGMSDEDYQKKYKQQHYPTAAEVHKTLERNPEGAATRGLFAAAQMRAAAVGRAARRGVLQNDEWLDEWLGFAGRE